jgi:hypothetical protein
MRTDVTNRTESVAARIDSYSKTKLARAAEECDLTVSAYLESVIEEHIDRNPRGLRALESSPSRDSDQMTATTPTESPDGFVEEMLEGLE